MYKILNFNPIVFLGVVMWSFFYMFYECGYIPFKKSTINSMKERFPSLEADGED